MEASYVSPGKPRVTGGIYRAPLKTALPTDASSQLDDAFVELGFVSEDGVTNNNTPETEDTYAWGGTPVMKTVTEKPDEWTFTLIESINPNVLKTVYGDSNVTVDDSEKTISVKATSGEAASAVYVIDMMLKGGALKRVVIPNGALGEVGEIVYKDDEPIGYEITVAAMDDGSGTTHYEYIQLPA